MTVTEFLLAADLIAILVLIVIVCARSGRSHSAREREETVREVTSRIEELEESLLDDTENRLTRRLDLGISDVRRDLSDRLRYDAEENRRNRTELSEMVVRGHERTGRSVTEAFEALRQDQLRELRELREELGGRLDSSLNERLDSSMRSVGDQLNRLYESLGELSKLGEGVYSLNRTLSNVKTRGIYGETQLAHILSDVLPSSLYDRNVVTKRSEQTRDAVEFAVKIPDHDNVGEFMYLPLDSKFPDAAMEKMMRAAEASDAKAYAEAVKELETRVRTDAADIAVKYLDPPYTTDFAVMFLPTESLYAEVLGIPGLADDLRRQYHVVITGPATVTALLDSLSLGFRYLAVNKDSQRILKLLGAVKTQYTKLSELVALTDRRLESARAANESLRRRTELINRKLAEVEELDPLDAVDLLGGAGDDMS